MPELFLRRLDGWPLELDVVPGNISDPAVRVVGVVEIEAFPEPPVPPDAPVGANDCELLKFLMICSTSVIIAIAI